MRATVIVGALVVMTAACAATPAVTYGEGTPDDLRQLVQSTWERFAVAFSAHADCMGGITLQGDRQIKDKARYEPTTGAVLVRIPGTVANLETALVHEFAHHLEFACPAHTELRPVFLRAQGLPADTEWFDGPSWEETPSEQYAEAAIQVVLGYRDTNFEMRLTPEAIEAVAAWGRGEG